ncbi:MAG: hypothetical protein SCK28_05460 [Bacillota bacterium]|nr:hypothetical protein [Bacillota bacterium]
MIKIKFIKKNFVDVIYNMASMSIYIFVQQIIIMPYISRNYDQQIFSNVIMFVTLYNIFTVVVGDELGNTRLVRNNKYINNNSDFTIILFFATLIINIMLLILNSLVDIIDNNLLIIILCTITMGIIRYYMMSYYKIDNEFSRILKLNISYSAGAVFGLWITTYFKLLLLPFLIGELFSIIYIIRSRKWHIEFRNITRSNEFENTRKVFLNLMFVSILINLISYMDRLMILPILGASAMAIYYASSTISKLISLIINPVSGVILAKLSNVSNSYKEKTIFFITRFVPVIIIFGTVGSVILSYFGVLLLYPMFLTEARQLFIPIGITTSLSSIVYLIKPILIRFFNSRIYTIINLIYAAVFIVSVSIASSKWGITGFVWASTISKFIQFSCMIVSIKNEGDGV